MSITNEFNYTILSVDGRDFYELCHLVADVDLGADGQIETVNEIFTAEFCWKSSKITRRNVLAKSHPLWALIADHVLSEDPFTILDEQDWPEQVDDAREHGFGKFEYGLS